MNILIKIWCLAHKLTVIPTRSFRPKHKRINKQHNGEKMVWQNPWINPSRVVFKPWQRLTFFLHLKDLAQFFSILSNSLASFLHPIFENPQTQNPSEPPLAPRMKLLRRQSRLAEAERKAPPLPLPPRKRDRSVLENKI